MDRIKNGNNYRCVVSFDGNPFKVGNTYPSEEDGYLTTPEGISIDIDNTYPERTRPLFLHHEVWMDSSPKHTFEKIKTKDMSEKINHPPHYGGKENPFEPIKIIEAENLSFHRGNVLKYLLRAGKKDKELQDLRKAQWYLNREIEILENKNLDNPI